MHTEQLTRRHAEADARAKEQAVRLAGIAGVAAAAERVSPEMPATVRYGDPELAALYEKEARLVVVEEALTKLESYDLSGDAPVTSVREVEGIGSELAGTLEAAGLNTPDDLRAASDEYLLAIDGIGRAKLRVIRDSV